MESYLNAYDSFDTKLVYIFELQSGGIGDLLKYFLVLINLCMKYNIKLYYYNKNKLLDDFFYLSCEKMAISEAEAYSYKRCNINDIPFLKKSNNYSIYPSDLHKLGAFNTISEIAIYKNRDLQNLFSFSSRIITQSRDIIDSNITYISLHLRLGDHYLETDKSFITCPNDKRGFSETKINEFIDSNPDKVILFFCDNNSFKLKIKERYNYIIITDYNIGHTALLNTTEEQVINTLVEFYLLSRSKHIYVASNSGFPIMAGLLNNVPISNI